MRITEIREGAARYLGDEAASRFAWYVQEFRRGGTQVLAYAAWARPDVGAGEPAHPLDAAAKGAPLGCLTPYTLGAAR